MFCIYLGKRNKKIQKKNILFIIKFVKLNQLLPLTPNIMIQDSINSILQIVTTYEE